MARVPSLYKRGKVTAGVVILALAMASPTSAELTVQGWLDFYNGQSRSRPAVGRIAANTYVLGVADALISTRIMSCPPRYIPDAEALANRVASILTMPNPSPGISVPSAVLGALDLDGCTKGPRGKATP